jgi:2-amino-4-hydroxy-6-hydroxymethyldihydropteridine diphosphokinase
MNRKEKVYLGLGTNLGEKKENLVRAIEKLSLALGPCTACSTFIETEPWGFKSNNGFLNCVAAFETELTPFGLLDATERIERELGRTAKSDGANYHDRIIDIDILLYGDTVINSERLTIPHPLMHRRDFVLEPLAEIAPETIHPLLRKSIGKLLEELRPSSINRRHCH